MAMLRLKSTFQVHSLPHSIVSQRLLCLKEANDHLGRCLESSLKRTANTRQAFSELQRNKVESSPVLEEYRDSRANKKECSHSQNGSKLEKWLLPALSFMHKSFA